MSPRIGRQGGLALALVAVLAGAVLLVIGLRAQTSPPTAQSAGQIDPAGPSSSPSTSTTPAPTGSTAPDPSAPITPGPLGPSKPVSISIPAIKVNSKVFSIGQNPDGTIAVPQPGPRENLAAWYRNSPTPGQPGPAIIEGHVDTTSGPSVFYELGKVKPGQKIHVRRADGVTATYTVDAVRTFLKAQFPTDKVYGAKDLSVPTLRLITCSQFDETKRTHVSNDVVFAHLTKISGRATT